MLELLGSGLVSLWLDMAGVQIKPLNALDALAWQTGISEEVNYIKVGAGKSAAKSRYLVTVGADVIS
jgi:hypothetical protein